MYFFKRHHKQAVDFRGDFILTHNKNLVVAKNTASAPRYAENAQYIADIPNLTRRDKLRATFRAIRFIWGKSQALDPQAVLEHSGKALHPDAIVRLKGIRYTVEELREVGWTDEQILDKGDII